MRDAKLYLADMLAAINSIQTFTAGQTFEAFQSDDKTMSAVVRKMEIIGEAANAVPGEVKEIHPDVPWKDMVGMRNRLIHFYFGIKASVVWDTIQKDLPPLKKLIEGALSKAE